MDRVDLGGRLTVAEIPGQLFRVLREALKCHVDRTAALERLAPEVREGAVGGQHVDGAGLLREAAGSAQRQVPRIAAGLLIDVRGPFAETRLAVAEVPRKLVDRAD